MRGYTIGAIVALVLNLVVTLVLFVPALFLAMASDGCSTGCALVVVEAGFYTALIGPALVFLTGLVFTIIAFTRKTNPLWPALISLGGIVGAFLLGVGMTFLAIG